MEQLTLDVTGRIEWRDVPAPRLEGDGEALVRPLAVTRCDIDLPYVAGFLPPPRPFALGHECVGEITALGDGVRGFRVGQRVIVPFQISCGQCDRCRRGQTGSCRTAGPGASYGLGALGGLEWGGALADLVRVPYADAMLVPLPAGISARSVASMSDNIPDGWRTVAPGLERWPGAPVLVVGGGAVGIPVYAVGIALALGAERVDYLDHDPVRLARAERVGAHPVEGPYPRRAGRYPITVDASGIPAGLVCALRSTDVGGVCTSVAIYWDEVALPLLEMYTRGVTFVTARVDARAAIPAALGLVDGGRFQPELVTETVAPWDEAPAVLARHRAKTVIVRDDA